MFQSTPPHGGRLDFETITGQNFMFQSTPPHGGRHLFGTGYPFTLLFQSTPPHGGRRALHERFRQIPCVSIHAPAWGATYVFPQKSDGLKRFNPRPRMGGD